MIVGIIGTGLMGSAIAERMIKKGFTVYVNNRTKQRSDALVRKNATNIGSPSELGKKCNYVIISVTDGNAVREDLIR